MVHRDPSYWISGLCITSSTPRPHFQRVTWDHLWNIEILGGVASVKGTWDRNPGRKWKIMGKIWKNHSKRYSHHYSWRRPCSSPSKVLKPFEIVLPPCLLLVTNSNGWTFTPNCCISLHNSIYHVQITPKLHPWNGGKSHPLFGGMLLRVTSPPSKLWSWGSTICDLWSQFQIQVAMPKSSIESSWKWKGKLTFAVTFHLTLWVPHFPLRFNLPIVPNTPWKLQTRSAHLCATQKCMKYNSSAWSVGGGVWNRDCNLDYMCIPTDPIL